MKQIIVMVSVLAMTFCARADYLYWMIDPVEEQYQFAYAMLAAEDESGENKTYLTVGDTGDTIVIGDFSAPVVSELSDIYSLMPSSPEALRYFVELYSLQGDVVAVTQSATYSDLWNRQAIYREMSITGMTSVYHFSVPEPSGGILFLLGFGLLSLRRKRRG